MEGSNRKDIAEQIQSKAAQEIKSLILEELASLKPFPQMEIGFNITKNSERCKETKKEPGIIVRNTIGPEGINIALARYIVLKPEGSYNFKGACIKTEDYIGWWNFHERFLVREDSEFSPLHENGYLKYYQNIFQTIEQVKETCVVC